MDPVPSHPSPDGVLPDTPPAGGSALADPTERIPELPGNVRAADPAYLTAEQAEDVRWFGRAAAAVALDAEQVLALLHDGRLLDALQQAERLQGIPAGARPVSQILQGLWESTRVLRAAGDQLPGTLLQRPVPPARQEAPYAAS